MSKVFGHLTPSRVRTKRTKKVFHVILIIMNFSLKFELPFRQKDEKDLTYL